MIMDLSLTKERIFLAVMCLTAFCGLVYELALANTLTFLLGDTILYFSLVIGLFLLAMGIGSYISYKIGLNPLTDVYQTEKNISALAVAELLLGLIGGGSVLALLWLGSVSVHAANAVSGSNSFQLLLASTLPLHIAGIILITAVGVLVGLEIPLIYRLLTNTAEKRLALVLAADYLGSFMGSIFFPLFLLPSMGILGVAFFVGILNLGAGMIVVVFASASRRRIFGLLYGLGIIILVISFRSSEAIENYLDTLFYSGRTPVKIVERIRSPYQKIVLTARQEEGREELSLFLNGYIQFDSKGESQAYHETLVHPAMHLAKSRKNILILGGGDGLPAKEILKYQDAERIVNVDIDEAIINLSKNNTLLREFNSRSFSNPRVSVVIGDAFLYVRSSREKFDVVIVDFPEGIDIPLARSYSLQFIRDLKRILSPGGIVVFQVDTYDTLSYWSVVKTIGSAGLYVLPAYTGVVAGDSGPKEGVILASNGDFDFSRIEKINKFWAEPILAARDLDFSHKLNLVEENTFYRPIFLHYFKKEFWPVFWLGSS